MGISIKREETEKLARELAKRKGEGLTDAIHHALEGALARLPDRPRTRAEVDEQLARLIAESDARRALGRDNGKSREQIEAEMYGEHGEPI